ncbi:putative membrane protein [Acinetobacter baumannii 1437282]|nr:putative membrane protein [Acinetobacter baumannii 1437282]
MMKNENYLRTSYPKDKGWFWFGLIVFIQLLFIIVSYLMINLPL